MLAGLLYTGSGLGLASRRLARRAERVRLPRADRLPLAGAVLFGGVVAPVLQTVPALENGCVRPPEVCWSLAGS